MQDKLLYIVEGMLIITSVASLVVAGYVMMVVSNMPYAV